jgi:Spy/CpxP family protein refolding chaperone
MKRQFIFAALSAILATGLLIAQAPRERGGGKQGGRARMFDMLASRLNLNDAQKEQARAALDAAHQQSRPVAEQLKTAQDALRDAVKTGRTDAEIDQLAARQGELMGQMAAIHTKAMARIYATLTPEQKQNADQLHHGFGNMFGRRPPMNSGPRP